MSFLRPAPVTGFGGLSWGFFVEVCVTFYVVSDNLPGSLFRFLCPSTLVYWSVSPPVSCRCVSFLGGLCDIS